jgi:hypothetical protein
MQFVKGLFNAFWSVSPKMKATLLIACFAKIKETMFTVICFPVNKRNFVNCCFAEDIGISVNYCSLHTEMKYTAYICRFYIQHSCWPGRVVSASVDLSDHLPCSPRTQPHRVPTRHTSILKIERTCSSATLTAILMSANYHNPRPRISENTYTFVFVIPKPEYITGHSPSIRNGIQMT